jgi:hypothetical protein
MDHNLFRDITLENFLKTRRDKAALEIEKLFTADNQNTDESELIEHVYKKYKSEPLIIFKDRVNRPYANHAEHTLEFSIPFTGNVDLFTLKPSTFYQPEPLKGSVISTGNIIKISIRKADKDNIITEFERSCSNIDKHLKDINKQCEEINSRLYQYIEIGIRKRCKAIKILDDAAKDVGILLKEKTVMHLYSIHVKHCSLDGNLFEKDVQIEAKNEQEANLKMAEMKRDPTPQGLLSGFGGGTSTCELMLVK